MSSKVASSINILFILKFDNSFINEIVSENELPLIADGNDNEHYPDNRTDDINNEDKEHESEDDEDTEDNELPLIVDD